MMLYRIIITGPGYIIINLKLNILDNKNLKSQLKDKKYIIVVNRYQWISMMKVIMRA